MLRRDLESGTWSALNRSAALICCILGMFTILLNSSWILSELSWTLLRTSWLIRRHSCASPLSVGYASFWLADLFLRFTGVFFLICFLHIYQYRLLLLVLAGRDFLAFFSLLNVICRGFCSGKNYVFIRERFDFRALNDVVFSKRVYRKSLNLQAALFMSILVRDSAILSLSADRTFYLRFWCR